VLGLLVPLILLLIVGGIVALVVVAVNRGRQRGAEAGLTVSPKAVFLYLLAAATLYISASVSWC